jgi:outer membrane protein OmpA-like peptidoglycan-associated protein
MNRIETMTMKNFRLASASLISAAVLAACNTLPASDSPIMLARADYASAQANPQVNALAPLELKQAGDALDRANAASAKREDDKVVDHLAYVAKQQVTIARETAAQKAAEQAVAAVGAERDRVRLEARTREADSAQRSAELSQRQAEGARRSAEASQRQSEESQRSAESSQRVAMAERQAATDAQQASASARQQAMDAEGRARQLEAQLAALEARKTERGMVITLGDVLFDTNRAQLSMGGMRNVQKLADFFKQYPKRTVMIEGFTDSTGTQGRNQGLSNERADSVRVALLGMGVNADRITSRGYGESYPVAGNETAAGRQLNRRVEVVVSDDNGKIAPR